MVFEGHHAVAEPARGVGLELGVKPDLNSPRGTFWELLGDREPT